MLLLAAAAPAAEPDLIRSWTGVEVSDAAVR